MKTPFTFSADPENCKDMSGNPEKNHRWETKKVRVLSESSRLSLKALVAKRLEKLVFRRVATVVSGASQKHFELGPDGQEKELTLEEVRKMALADFYRTVVTRSFQSYSLTTVGASAAPAHDVFEREPILALSVNRRELDPVSLTWVSAAKTLSCPRPSNRRSPEQDDPASLICGEVVRNKRTGLLEYSRWFMASLQTIRWLLLTLYPDSPVPVRKGEIKTGPAERPYELGGNRVVTNTYRKMEVSERHSDTPLSLLEKKKHFRVCYGPEMEIHNCHTLAMWVLAIRYGELPSPENIPDTVPSTDAKAYKAKPMRSWDLPNFPSEGKTRIRLDHLLAKRLNLHFEWKDRETLVNKLSLRPPTFVDFLEDEFLAPDSAVTTVSRPSSPIDVREYEGLSQDSGVDEAVPEPQEQVFVYQHRAWADAVEDADAEVDFDLPLTFSHPDPGLSSFPTDYRSQVISYISSFFM